MPPERQMLHNSQSMQYLQKHPMAQTSIGQMQAVHQASIQLQAAQHQASLQAAQHQASLQAAHQASLQAAHQASLQAHQASLQAAHQASLQAAHQASLQAAHQASLQAAHQVSLQAHPSSLQLSARPLCAHHARHAPPAAYRAP